MPGLGQIPRFKTELRGNWHSATLYDEGDYVYFGTYIYRAIYGNLDAEPTSSPDIWAETINVGNLENVDINVYVVLTNRGGTAIGAGQPVIAYNEDGDCYTPQSSNTINPCNVSPTNHVPCNVFGISNMSENESGLGLIDGYYTGIFRGEENGDRIYLANLTLSSNPSLFFYVMIHDTSSFSQSYTTNWIQHIATIVHYSDTVSQRVARIHMSGYSLVEQLKANGYQSTETQGQGQVYSGVIAEDPVNATPANNVSSPYTITGLTPNAPYAIYSDLNLQLNGNYVSYSNIDIQHTYSDGFPFTITAGSSYQMLFRKQVTGSRFASLSNQYDSSTVFTASPHLLYYKQGFDYANHFLFGATTADSTGNIVLTRDDSGSFLANEEFIAIPLGAIDTQTNITYQSGSDTPVTT